MSNEAMSHEEVIQNIPAYAVGGLDIEETAALEEHLRGCETCRRELASYEPLLGGLGLAAPESSPPEGARERLLERLEEQRRGGNVHSLWSARRAGRSRQRLPWMAAASSLLVALFLGGAALQVHSQVRELNEEVAEQEETIGSVVGLMEQSDLEVSDMMVSDSGARTRIYESSEGDVGMFVFDRLPSLAENQVYQLWVDTGDGMQSEGTFRPTDPERGSYHKLLEPPGGFEEYETVGVAPAPEDGLSEAPPESEMTVRQTVGETLGSVEGEASGATDSVDAGDSRAADAEAADAEASEPSGTGEDTVSQAPAPEGASPVETPETPTSGEDLAAGAPLGQSNLPEQP